jgi:thiol-disulfide isomerase/thioredoxin
MDSPRNGSARNWLLIAAGFCVFWAVYLSLFGPRRPRLGDGAGGEPASYNWTLRDLQDKPTSFEQFKGKPVFLNVWATWCGPCVREMPSIARLAETPSLRDKGIAFVCVSVDDSTEKVRRFVEGRGWQMSFFRAESTPPVFSTDGIPATFIIAPDGRVVTSEVGAAEWDSPETIALLEKLAAEAPKAR